MMSGAVQAVASKHSKEPHSGGRRASNAPKTHLIHAPSPIPIATALNLQQVPEALHTQILRDHLPTPPKTKRRTQSQPAKSQPYVSRPAALDPKYWNHQCKGHGTAVCTTLCDPTSPVHLDNSRRARMGIASCNSGARPGDMGGMLMFPKWK